jgi:hypothetical protein
VLYAHVQNIKASTACYRDSFYFIIQLLGIIIKKVYYYYCRDVQCYCLDIKSVFKVIIKILSESLVRVL